MLAPDSPPVYVGVRETLNAPAGISVRGQTSGRFLKIPESSWLAWVRRWPGVAETVGVILPPKLPRGLAKSPLVLEPGEKPIERKEAEKTEFVCPKCQSPMLKKVSRRGPFLACSAYPKCRSTMNIGPDGKPVPRKADEATGEICPNCSSPMIRRWKGKRPFLACSAYPKCKTTKSLGAESGGGAPHPQGAPANVETTDVECPNCGKKMVIREGRFGKFMACSGYPACKTTKKLDADGRPAPQ